MSMSTLQKKEDMEMSMEEEEKFLYGFGECTKEETEYLIRTGQLVEKDGEFLNISTLSESGFANMSVDIPKFEDSVNISVRSFVTTPAPCGSSSIDRENTFIGLGDVNLFEQTTAESPKPATPRTVQSTPATPACVGSIGFVRENTFIGLNDVNLFDQTARDSPMPATPLIVQSTPATPACERSIGFVRENTFIGLNDVNLFDQTARDSPMPATPLIVQSTPATPACERSIGFVRENTFIGLNDVNLFDQTAVESPKSSPLVVEKRKSASYTVSRPASAFCTPVSNDTASISRRMSKTFSGSKNNSSVYPVLKNNKHNVSLELLKFEDKLEIAATNDSDDGIMASPFVHDENPEPINTNMNVSSLQKSRARTSLNVKNTPATPRGKIVGLVRENTFIGLHDVNLFQTPVAMVSPRRTTRNSRSSTASRPLIEFCTPTTNTANTSRRMSKTCSGSKNNSSVLHSRKQNMSVDLLKFEDSGSIIVHSQDQQQSINLMNLDSSKDCSKSITASKEDLDDTIDTMTKLLALADEQEAEEAVQNVQMVEESPAQNSEVLATPSPLKTKRLMQLWGKNSLFSPSPPRPLPSSTSTPIFKTPTSRPKTPKLIGSSPSRKLYADIPAKVDSGLRKSSPSGFSLGLDSPVADYIHSKAAPSPFQRVIGIPNRIMSTGKPVNTKPAGTTMIPRPSLPFLAGSSKFNSQLSSSSGLQTEVKFKQLQYTGSKATLMNNASFAEKHQKENYVAERHTGVRAENVDVSMVQGGVIEKKFLGPTKKPIEADSDMTLLPLNNFFAM